MEHNIKAENYDRVSLSEHDGGLWMTIWKVGAHASVHLNQQQLQELHQAIGEYMGDSK